MHISKIGVFLLVCTLGMCSAQNIAQGDPEHSVQIIHQAVVAKPGSAVPEVSTADLEQILHDQSAVVLDTHHSDERTPDWCAELVAAYICVTCID